MNDGKNKAISETMSNTFKAYVKINNECYQRFWIYAHRESRTLARVSDNINLII